MLLKTKFRFVHTLRLLSFTLVGLAASSAFSADGYTESPGTTGNGNFVIGPDRYAGMNLEPPEPAAFGQAPEFVVAETGRLF